MNPKVESANNIHTCGGTGGLLSSRGPDENLKVSDGTRILCSAMRVDQHQMFLGAFGPEQTKIVYTFVGILAKYDGLNIRSVCTSRSDCAAGSYIMLGDISGTAVSLVELGKAIQVKPWFEPVGTRVVAETVVDLKIIAPARRNLLLDTLSIISGEYGVNIESMVHRTYHNIYDHGFDLLRKISRGVEQEFPGGPARKQRGRGERKTNGNGKTRGNVKRRGTGGIGTGLGAGGGPGDETDFITVTHMRLELPKGTNLESLKHDLDLVGTDWEFRWEQRRGHGKFDSDFTKRLFGGLN